MKLSVLVTALMCSSLSFAAESYVIRDQVFKYLEKNVVGRTQKLATEGHLTSEGEEYLVKFDATISWAKLEKTEEGLTFEETRDIKQSSQKVGKDGKPVGEIIKSDRVVVHQHAVAERASTKSLVGLTTISKNTLEDPTGKGFVSMIELSPDGKELYIYESATGFSEVSLDGKSLLAVSGATEATFFLNAAGKLQTIETAKFYKVDVNKDFAREEISRFNLSASEIAP